MDHLFAYGTLMCEDIMEEVAGCRLTSEPGILRGYRRRRVKGQLYPGIAPEAGQAVEGVVYRHVPDSAWLRLDRFEGPMYVRRLVEVESTDGRRERAFAYVVRHSFLDRLGEEDWDFATFLREGKMRFRETYEGYSRWA
ncbi:Uncharacterized conserved protein YtfP, gamma-glutamylcyclotransferase (GGCT)/AIG2-like family [Desulfacinum infernum DSM 9756]|uniref:Putative gamma-glutamylcyclotransferase n=1 Tax=Desulfacinum infernum DSM 9756 TaxID=1121391 RepID=A0A1M4ZEV6_9BACT|nr:gamma-glutamylcyclotransferase family protein [Desulfacinum infernum]SHF16573.1 Uncharacterized conserved protein YtfP, gamma-glutamylcyclotransferase (GGCT)/AIG2-like family [Desulfacinum infernum DSM 9756]